MQEAVSRPDRQDANATLLAPTSNAVAADCTKGFQPVFAPRLQTGCLGYLAQPVKSRNRRGPNMIKPTAKEPKDAISTPAAARSFASRAIG
jgi:hypothetical protein